MATESCSSVMKAKYDKVGCRIKSWCIFLHNSLDDFTVNQKFEKVTVLIYLYVPHWVK